MENKSEVEQLKEQEEIKTALKQTAGTKETMAKPVAKAEDKFWFGTYIFILLGLIVLYALLGSDLFSNEIQSISLLRRLSIGVMLVVLVVAIAKSIRYVWNEIKFQVAYDSDLQFITQTMQQVVEEELGERMLDLVLVYRELLKQTPVDQLEIQERPVVHFCASENTWLDAIVRYLVHPKESGRVKTRLTKKLLDKLNAEPERVMFPKSNLR